MKETKKMRVAWVPQIGAGEIAVFYIPVRSVEAAEATMAMLAAYDAFQWNHHIKGDYANSGCLEVFNEETQEWEGWYSDDGKNFYDDTQSYCMEKSPHCKELMEFEEALFSQVHFNEH